MLGDSYEMDARTSCADLKAGAWVPSWSRSAVGTAGSSEGAASGGAGNAVTRAAGVGSEIALAFCARYSAVGMCFTLLT